MVVKRKKKKKTKKVVIVSRHPTFVEFIKKAIPSLKNKKIEFLQQADPKKLRNKVVVTSSLPLHLMSSARKVITVDLKFPRDPQERAKALKELEKSPSAYKKYLVSISEYKVQRRPFLRFPKKKKKKT